MNHVAGRALRQIAPLARAGVEADGGEPLPRVVGVGGAHREPLQLVEAQRPLTQHGLGLASAGLSLTADGQQIFVTSASTRACTAT